MQTRSREDKKEVAVGGVTVSCSDNYAPAMIQEAVALINGRYEQNIGGIDLDNMIEYAKTGVDYISSGAIIHHASKYGPEPKAQLL